MITTPECPTGQHGPIQKGIETKIVQGSLKEYAVYRCTFCGLEEKLELLAPINEFMLREGVEETDNF